jgi:tripartite-type tricarboxylate transporter receptor subunit TctC
MNRRRVLRYLAGLAPATAGLYAVAQDNAFPNKPIRMVASSVPGTLTDVAARLYAERMAAYLRQPVVVENVAGASSLLAVRQVLKAPADGYTLLVSASTLVTTPHVNPKAGYAVTDFSAVGEMVRSPVLLVTSATSPYKTLRELLTAAGKAPASISYGSSGIGTTNHLAAELLARQANVKFTHVPYKGIAAAVPDVVAGRVGFLMGTATSVIELMKSGSLRCLAISSDKRSPQFPDIPTLKELGYPNASFELWIGAVAPAGIPRDVRTRLGAAMEAARNDPELVRRLEAAGQEISAVRTPEQFESVLRADEERFRKVVKEANIVAE